jgi:hypothetical protein
MKCGEFIDQLGAVRFSRRNLLHGVSKYMKCGGKYRYSTKGIIVHRLL